MFTGPGHICRMGRSGAAGAGLFRGRFTELFFAGVSPFVFDASLFAAAGAASFLSAKFFDCLGLYCGTAVSNGIELIA